MKPCGHKISEECGCEQAAPYPEAQTHIHTSDCEKSKDHKDAHQGAEGRMHQTQLAHLISDATMLLDMFDDSTNLPEWLEVKITKASDYITSAARYLAGEHSRDQGRLGAKKNCGCGKDPCITYGS